MPEIAFVLPGGGVSGGVRATVKLANILKSRNNRVRILVRRSDVVSTMRRTWFRFRYHRKNNDWIKYFNGNVSYFRDIEKCHFQDGEHIVGAGSWASREIGKIRFQGVIKTQYYHGHTPENIDLMKGAMSLKIPKIVVASYLIPIIRNISGEDVLAVVPNGVDRMEYYPVMSEEHRNGIGAVFSRETSKAPEILKSVLTSLKADLPGLKHYTFGSGRRPNSLRYSNYSRFPTVQEARDIYSRCRIWIVPSKNEGFSLPILEAMSCGCIVISTDSGGPRDIIHDGENGFIVKVGDVDGIVKKVKALLRDDALIKIIQVNGMETAKKFSWENTAKRFEDSLRKIRES